MEMLTKSSAEGTSIVRKSPDLGQILIGMINTERPDDVSLVFIFLCYTTYTYCYIVGCTITLKVS